MLTTQTGMPAPWDRTAPSSNAHALQRVTVAHLGLEDGAGHEVGLYPVMYLDGTLGSPVPVVGVRGLGGRRRTAADYGAHQLVSATVDHPLPVVHNGPDETVRLGHEPELKKYGHVVPVHDPGADLVPAKRPHELAVPDAIGNGEYEASAAPELLPQAGSQQELDAGQVDLTQVPSVVHVRQVHVQVSGQAHGRVYGRVGDPEFLLDARRRHVTEQRPEEIRQGQRAHENQDQRERCAYHRQYRHRQR